CSTAYPTDGTSSTRNSSLYVCVASSFDTTCDATTLPFASSSATFVAGPGICTETSPTPARFQPSELNTTTGTPAATRVSMCAVIVFSDFSDTSFAAQRTWS